jgi:hypothetical protein
VGAHVSVRWAGRPGDKPVAVAPEGS